MTRSDIDKLQEEIEELFADLWQVPRFSGLRHGFRPNVDCFHTDDPHALTVVVELPGRRPAQSVRVVAGERAARRSPASASARRSPGRVYQQMEIEYGAVPAAGPARARTSTRARATARFEHGVLTIELPVVEQAAADGPRSRSTVRAAMTDVALRDAGAGGARSSSSRRRCRCCR